MFPIRTLLLTIALLTGCGPSLDDQENKARAALNAKDWAGAVAAADLALAHPDADAAAKWRSEQIKLDAMAGNAQGADVMAALERLAGTYAAQVTPALYRALADKVKTAGDTMGAIDILAAGDKRFPAEHDNFVKAIDELKAGGMDPAEIEKLKALGYL